MEPLWGPVVATGGNPSQMRHLRNPQNQAKTVAVGCDRLPRRAHGKERVCHRLQLVAEAPLSVKEGVELQALRRFSYVSRCPREGHCCTIMQDLISRAREKQDKADC